MISLTRKAVALQAYQLNSAVEMFDALSALTAQGWRGQISADETGSYRLEANADAPVRQIIAEVGDVLVDDLGWRLLSSEESAANYDEVAP